ncbi:MAG: AAA-like domain-containing protein [Thainema sp.]
MSGNTNNYEYQVGGSLPPNSPTYVKRRADDDLYTKLTAGEFCYVLNSRQMGKSSLRVQTMQRLKAEGIACAVIDITAIGSQNISADQWYAGIIRSLTTNFNLARKVNLRTWLRERDFLTPIQRLGEFIEFILLEEIDQPIVVFIDEIDGVLSFQFSIDDFFAYIRFCSNQRVDKPIYKKLTFCLLGVAAPAALIQDKRRTPFNIGHAIPLRGFQFDEARSLTLGLQKKAENPESVLQEILVWTGGQPFLTQKVCDLVRSLNVFIHTKDEVASIAHLVRTHIIDSWENQDEPEHLRTIRDRLLSDEKKTGSLLSIYQQVLQKGSIYTDGSQEQTELRLSGLVFEQNGKLRVYNRIYELIFSKNWIDSTLANLRPYAEALAAWINSSYTDSSRLLRGQALRDALVWSSNKSLSISDYSFLSASQSLEREMMQAELRAQQKANRILEKAKQKVELALQQEQQAKQKMLEAEHQSAQAMQRLELALEQERRIEAKVLKSEKKSFPTKHDKHKKDRTPFVGFSIAVFLLAAAIGQRFYNEPKLTVGTVAPQTFVAPENATITDEAATAERRRAAENGSLKILMIDSAADQAILNRLQQLLNQGTQIRQNPEILTQEELQDSSFFYLHGETLLNFSSAEWWETQTAIRDIVQEILAGGIAQGTPDSVLQRAVDWQVESSVPAKAQSFATKLILEVLKPNLIEDSEQTRMAAQRAAQAVDPVQYTVQEGGTIVAVGEEITQETFVVLDYFGLSRRGVNWIGFVGFGIAITGSVTLFLWVEQTFYLGLRHRDHILLFLLALSTPVVAVVNSSIVTLPAVGLLTGSFYGSILSVTVVGLLAVLLPIGLELSMVPFIAAAAGGIVGGIMAGRLRSREELALLGGAVGLTQAVVYLLLTLIFTGGSSPIWYLLIANSAWHGFIGLAWSVVALGISPYLEHVFDLVTAIRLAELSNPNRPLLKRFAYEAPGTFQHTMFVASLAEAAARALNCNVELVRAGTLYHDIGKMHDPLGFIENQMGGPNKHDEINDPWKSAVIIKKNVTEGIVMAKKCRLPKAVRAFIPEHQGTMLITYFYHQAQQMAETDSTIILNEQDFRYDGPIPQSRETGIVMSAHYCAKSLRLLKAFDPIEALKAVHQVLQYLDKDGQLLDSGLRQKELDQIADIFVQVWLQSQWSGNLLSTSK